MGRAVIMWAACLSLSATAAVFINLGLLCLEARNPDLAILCTVASVASLCSVSYVHGMLYPKQ